MRIYNAYIITVSSLLLMTTVVLLALGLNTLGIYYTLYVIEVLAVTELYSYFNAKARHGLNMISILLLIGFCAVVAFQTYQTFH